MDLTKLSREELLAVAEGRPLPGAQQAPSQLDLSSLDREQLQAVAEGKPMPEKAGLGSILERGTDLTQSGLFRSLQGYAKGRVLEGIEYFGETGAQRNIEEADRALNPERLLTWDEAKGLSGVGRYALEQGLLSAPGAGMAALGGIAGTALAGPAGGIAGLGLGSYPQLYGSNLQRQIDEYGEITDNASAAQAALGQAALEGLFSAIPLGKVAGRFVGPGLLAPATKVGRAIDQNLVPRVIKGAGVSALGEGSTEAAQQALERWQAGLDLLNDDAYNEYKQSFITGALIGGPIGGVSSIFTKPDADPNDPETLRANVAAARLAQDEEVKQLIETLRSSDNPAERQQGIALENNLQQTLQIAQQKLLQLEYKPTQAEVPGAAAPDVSTDYGIPPVTEQGPPPAAMSDEQVAGWIDQNAGSLPRIQAIMGSSGSPEIKQQAISDYVRSADFINDLRQIPDNPIDSALFARQPRRNRKVDERAYPGTAEQIDEQLAQEEAARAAKREEAAALKEEERRIAEEEAAARAAEAERRQAPTNAMMEALQKFRQQTTEAQLPEQEGPQATADAALAERARQLEGFTPFQRKAAAREYIKNLPEGAQPYMPYLQTVLDTSDPKVVNDYLNKQVRREDKSGTVSGFLDLEDGQYVRRNAPSEAGPETRQPGPAPGVQLRTPEPEGLPGPVRMPYRPTEGGRQVSPPLPITPPEIPAAPVAEQPAAPKPAPKPKAAAPKPAPAPKVVEPEPEPEPEVEEEIDYDEHPLMKAHEERTDEAVDAIYETENSTELRKLAKKYLRDDLIDDDGYSNMDEAIREAEREYKHEEGQSALEDAVREYADNKRYDIEAEIDEAVQEERDFKAAQRRPSEPEEMRVLREEDIAPPPELGLDETAREQRAAEEPTAEQPAAEEGPKLTPEEVAKKQETARKRLNEIMAEIKARGPSGRIFARAFEEALKDRRFTPAEVYHAYLVADTATTILRGTKAMPNVTFVKESKAGPGVAGTYLAPNGPGVRGLLEFAIREDLGKYARETAAHEPFHLLQDLINDSDPEMSRILFGKRVGTNERGRGIYEGGAFFDGMQLSDLDPTVRNFLETHAPAPGQPSYWDELTDREERLSKKVGGDRTKTAMSTQREMMAHVFGKLADARLRGVSLGNVKPVYKRMTDFLVEFKKRLASKLRGDGYRSINDILQTYADGKRQQGYGSEVIITRPAGAAQPQAAQPKPAQPKPAQTTAKPKEAKPKTEQVKLHRIRYEIKVRNPKSKKMTVVEVGDGIVNYGGRLVVISEVNGRKVPFYLSTGEGGKVGVPSGKWYPFFGIGPNGWINKGASVDIARYYGSPALKRVAEQLDRSFEETGIGKNGEPPVPSVNNVGAFRDSLKEALGFEGLDPTPANAARVANRIARFVRDIERAGAEPEAMMISEGAETFSPEMKKKAEEMEAKGVDPDIIWVETGLTRAPYDDKWRAEVPDIDSTLGPGLDGLVNDAKAKLGGVLLHDELYKAYPWLKDVEVVSDVNLSSGEGAYSGGKIKVSSIDAFGALRGKTRLHADELRNVLIHEIQHAVQKREDLFGGANAASPIYMIADSANKVALRRLSKIEEKVRAFVTDYVDQAGMGNLFERADKITKQVTGDSEAEAFLPVIAGRVYLKFEVVDPDGNPLPAAKQSAALKALNEDPIIGPLIKAQSALLQAKKATDEVYDAVIENGGKVLRSPKYEPLTRAKREERIYRGAPGERESRMSEARLKMAAEELAKARPDFSKAEFQNDFMIDILGGKPASILIPNHPKDPLRQYNKRIDDLRAKHFGAEPEAMEVGDDRDIAFSELAEAQRDKPERAMEAAQEEIRRYPSGPALGWALEHVGDLTHRMSERPESGSYGKGYVAEKTRTALNIIKNPVDAARISQIPDVQSLARYSEEHSRLPVYNKAQYHAREAAVSLGRRDLREAERHLLALQKMIDDGTYEQIAGAYSPSYESGRSAPEAMEVGEQETPSGGIVDDNNVYIVHGGSDFADIDLSRSGTGEPGDIRPLGKGVYGYVIDFSNPERAKKALAGARVYAGKYGGKRKALHVFKVPKTASFLFNGQPEIDTDKYPNYPKAISGLVEPPELQEFRAHAAAKPKTVDQNWSREADRLWNRVKNAADVRAEHLPVGLTEVSINRPGVAERVGRFDLNTPDEEIIQSVEREFDAPAPEAMEVGDETSADRLSKRLDEIGFVPRATVEELLGAKRPKYLNAVVKFMAKQRKKTVAGKLTPRDILKAWTITVGSQGADAIYADTIFAKTGFDIPAEFREASGKVRPEEAMAAWLETPAGQRALDSTVAGTPDMDAWEDGFALRRAYGDDRYATTRFINSLSDVKAVTDKVNAAKGDVGQITKAVQELNGIGKVKREFLKYMLGFGNTPTIDAVEINFWLTGKGDISKLRDERADFVRDVKKSGGGAFMSELINRIQQQMGDMRGQIPALSEIPEEFYYHVLHHWIWDKAKGVETTHRGSMRVMVEALETGEGGNELIDAIRVVPTNAQINNANATANQITAKVMPTQLGNFRTIGQTIGALSNAINHFFSPYKMQDKGYYRKKRYEAIGKINVATQKAKVVWNAMKDATPEHKRAVYSYLTTKGANPPNVPPALRAAAVSAKAQIGDISKMLLDRKLISQDEYDKWKDGYLPRLYMEYLQGPGAGGLIRGGLTPSDMDYLKKRLSLPQDLRVAKGEVKDPAFLSLAAILVPQRDMVLLDFMADIAKRTDVGWVLSDSMVTWRGRKVSPLWAANQADTVRRQATTEPDASRKQLMLKVAGELQALVDNFQNPEIPKGYVKMPNSPVYGPLAGVILKKEIKDDLVGIGGPTADMDGFEKMFGQRGFAGRATSMWKYSKTVLSPSAQFRQVLSNVVMLGISGVNVHQVPSRLLRAIKTMKDGEKDEYFRIGQKYGVGATGMVSQELYTALDEMEASLKLDAKLGTINIPAFHAATKKFLSVVEKVKNAAEGAYDLGDTLFKYAKIIDEMERSKPKGPETKQQREDREWAAADQAHKWFLDYSEVPNWIKTARGSIIGAPFITYYYKVAPLMLEVFLTKPWRLWPAVALYYGAYMAASAAFGADDDDLEKLRKVAPEYIAKNPNALPVPFIDEEGRPQLLDVGYLYPWQMFVNIATAAGSAVTGKGSATDVITATGMLGNPILNVGAAMLTNTDPFTDKEIVNKYDPVSQQISDRFSYAWSVVAPPFMATNGSLTQLINRASGEDLGVDRKGQPKLATSQLIARLFGINLYPIDPEYQRAQRLSAMMYDLNQTKSRLSYRLKDLNLPADERRKIIEEGVAEIRRRSDEIERFARETEIPQQLRARRGE